MNTNPRLFVRALTVFACLLFCLAAARGFAAEVKAFKGSIDLPTYPWSPVKHPYFRGTDKVNIYPYPMLDFLSREKTNRTYKTVVLENEYLRITFLPELGGKIHEVIDKTVNKPMFYVNHVVKPGLIGQCGAWTSGGVEWNTGPQGHTVSCMQPIPVIILPREKDGAQSVAIGETERIYGTRWTVVVTLRPGRSFIEERIRIYNPTEHIRPYYFWNCTAAPNTPGFRFIYPMTLGCDHAGEKFFKWPIDNGKDLSRGTNYEDASSIFAWHCDQDFFGSYNDDLDHGAVSYANHQQLPGKKAWTWGYGGFGKMHQMDLTDDDGPYNEVQTGPLLTQAQVGRLDPCQAVEWTEWWYPVHGIGGFTFANKDLAVNVSTNAQKLHLKLLGTAEWTGAEVKTKPASAKVKLKLSPSQMSECDLPWADGETDVIVSAKGKLLAEFSVPLQLPKREPPQRKPAPETGAELVTAAYQDLLFARFEEAENKFGKVLEKDPKSVEARVGLAFLKLDSDSYAAEGEARKALETDPDDGLANLVCAYAQYRWPDTASEALDHAWKASREPGTAVAGRALAGRLLMSEGQLQKAAEAVAGPGPWETDPTCRALHSYACLLKGDAATAISLARSNLLVEPLDEFTHAILWLANGKVSEGLGESVRGQAEAVLRLAEQFENLNEGETAVRILRAFYFDVVPADERDPLPGLYARRFTLGGSFENRHLLDEASAAALQQKKIGIWPHDPELRIPLSLASHSDGKALLLFGDLMFYLGHYAEARTNWMHAAGAGTEPAVAYRALGMAAKTLDNDLKAAREWLEKANAADPQDSIVARDLANVLLALVDNCHVDKERMQLMSEAKDKLKSAFAQGRGRSDYVALLAKAQNRLGDYSETARMLDHVRVTVWEGAHDVHDLFVEAHLAVGEAELKGGHATEALAEFNRALEYPVNLATGKLENAREAHIQYARGRALEALGRIPEAKAAWKAAADEPESNDLRVEEARKAAKKALEKES